ncbi:hypothetical protein [Blastococcus sp. CCUG 61487]|uniref:hypothetical protein n=1 Tax=Blastococcus sp. CCUG 61487 TaxID=1840703 RepID=UPI0010C0239D|nr:hypothetical protein [Blastococcus sp. CCUG 61487]
MGRKATWFGAGSIVSAPLLIGLGDQLRMAEVDTSASARMVEGEYGAEQAAEYLEQVAAASGAYTAAGALTYAGALLLVPALVTIWRLSVGGSPRWAWAGAVLGTLGVLGHMVHLQGYYATNLAAAEFAGQPWTGELMMALEEQPFTLALFVPFLVGWLAAVPQAVGLRRARVIPTWAMGSVLAGTLVFLVVGSTPWSTGLWMVALIAGFAPAAAAAVRTAAPAEVGAPVEPVPAGR